MEIHGSDIIINSNLPIADSLIRLLVQDHWPNMVYEIDERPDGVDMFVYKDEAAKKAWDEEGWSEENDTRMIYFIFDPGYKVVSATIDDYKTNEYIVKDIVQFIRKCDNGNTKDINVST